MLQIWFTFRTSPITTRLPDSIRSNASLISTGTGGSITVNRKVSQRVTPLYTLKPAPHTRDDRRCQRKEREKKGEDKKYIYMFNWNIYRSLPKARNNFHCISHNTHPKNQFSLPRFQVFFSDSRCGNGLF